jgi:capsular polysaccharide biosynthesis protein
MNDFFDNQKILLVIRNRFIHFVVIGIVAIVLAALFSSPVFITPKFKSKARVYPINLAVMSTESETEQLLEIINSNDIKFRLFDVFKLNDIYKIPKSDPQYFTNMMSEYNSNVTAKKTEFETVELSVLDKDPERAARMCDSIIHFYNEKVREMHSAKNREVVKIVSDNIKLRTLERDSLLELLIQQREKYKILDFNSQVKEITRGYMEALAAGKENTQGGKEIKQLYDNLSQKGGEVYILEKRFAKTNMAIDSLKVLYDINLSEANKKITYCHVVEKPVPADKKSYPVRWIMVSMTLFASLFLSLLLFILLDYRKEK